MKAQNAALSAEDIANPKPPTEAVFSFYRRHHMPVEVADYIPQLDEFSPPGSDKKYQGPAQYQLIKHVLKNVFGSLGLGALTRTAAQLNTVGVTGVPGAADSGAATNAFVQQELAGAVGQTGVPIIGVVTATTQTAIAGQHLYLRNVAATTITLPASPNNGDMVWITPDNGLTSNVIGRNGKNIMGLAEDMTMDNPNQSYLMRYFTVDTNWRML